MGGLLAENDWSRRSVTGHDGHRAPDITRHKSFVIPETTRISFVSRVLENGIVGIDLDRI